MTSVSLSNLLANGRITKLVMRSVFRALDLPCEDSESRATLLSRFWEATREADKWIAFCDCEAISIMLGLEPGTRVSRDEREDLPRGDGVALRLDDEDLPPGSIVQFEPLHEPRTAPVTPGVAADELATRELDLAALVDEQLSVLMPAKGVQLEPSVRAFLIRAAAVRLDAGAREDLLSEPTAADFNSRVPIRGHVYRLDPAYAARDAGIEREQLAARSRIARFEVALNRLATLLDDDGTRAAFHVLSPVLLLLHDELADAEDRRARLAFECATRSRAGRDAPTGVAEAVPLATRDGVPVTREALQNAFDATIVFRPTGAKQHDANPRSQTSGNSKRRGSTRPTSGPHSSAPRGGNSWRGRARTSPRHEAERHSPTPSTAQRSPSPRARSRERP